MEYRARFPLIAVLLFLGAGAVRAQTVPADASTGAKESTPHSAVEPRFPAAPHWFDRKFLVDTFWPAHPSNDSLPISTTGQTYNFGGVLQSFANFGNTSGLRNTLQPFGGHVVLPLLRGRFELFGGTTGLFVPFATGHIRRNTWVTENQLGGRIPLDTDHRFWVGASGHYVTNFADKTRQWFYGTADFTVKLGH